ncbi:hypothetical protein LTR08_004344 [Meristemomyces frigidus]|nr:hypothetical protein LTR08_004344 [Meristemomyces frigidus]
MADNNMAGNSSDAPEASGIRRGEVTANEHSTGWPSAVEPWSPVGGDHRYCRRLSEPNTAVEEDPAVHDSPADDMNPPGAERSMGDANPTADDEDTADDGNSPEAEMSLEDEMLAALSAAQTATPLHLRVLAFARFWAFVALFGVSEYDVRLLRSFPILACLRPEWVWTFVRLCACTALYWTHESDYETQAFFLRWAYEVVASFRRTAWAWFAWFTAPVRRLLGLVSNWRTGREPQRVDDFTIYLRHLSAALTAVIEHEAEDAGLMMRMFMFVLAVSFFLWRFRRFLWFSAEIICWGLLPYLVVLIARQAIVWTS